MGDCLAAKLGDKLEHTSLLADFIRSEERRVGKEC